LGRCCVKVKEEPRQDGGRGWRDEGERASTNDGGRGKGEGGRGAGERSEICIISVMLKMRVA